MKYPSVRSPSVFFKWMNRLDFIKFVYHLEKFEFYAIRYPCNSLKYWNDVLCTRVSSGPLDELARYKHFLPDSRNFVALMGSVYLLFCAKYLYYIYFTLKSVDFYDLDKNLVQVEPRRDGTNHSGRPQIHEAIYEFVCLRTNCSSLSPPPPTAATAAATSHSQLSHDLVDFPIFFICNPALRWFYVPQFAPQSLMLFLISELIVFVLIMCVMIPVYQFVTPQTTNLAFFFAICPQTELSLARDQIRLLSIKIFSSLANFQASYRGASNTGRSVACSRNMRRKFLEQQQLQSQSNKSSSTHEVDISSELNPESGFVGDCLPLIRTDWWRHQWARGLVINYSLSLCSYLIGICFSILIVAHFPMAHYHEESRGKLDFAQENNCSIWIHGGDSIGTMEKLTLEEHILLKWNYYTFGEFWLVVVPPLYIVTITICNYYLVCCDELVWIIELREQLKLAINYTHLLKHREVSKDALIDAKQRHGAAASAAAESSINSQKSFRGQGCDDHESDIRSAAATTTTRKEIVDDFVDSTRISEDGQHKFQMSLLKQKLISTIEFDGILVHQRPRNISKSSSGSSSNNYPPRTTFEKQLADQQFALQLIQLFGLNLAVYAELLSKIQINYWHFMLYLRQNDQGITNVLIFASFLNYGLSVVAVYYNRNFRDLTLAPVAIIFLVLVTTCFFISIASNIHSDCCKLEPLIWQLLALNNDCDNSQVAHMRRLWLKELVALDEMGGLSHKFHRINITYIGIIEMLIWTSTLFLLSLTRIS